MYCAKSRKCIALQDTTTALKHQQVTLIAWFSCSIQWQDTIKDIADIVALYIAKNMEPIYTDEKPGFPLTPPVILQDTKPWVFF